MTQSSEELTKNIQACKDLPTAIELYGTRYDVLVDIIPYFRGNVCLPDSTSGVKPHIFLWCIRHDKLERGKCVACGGDITNGLIRKHLPTCSRECGTILRKSTTMEIHGVDNIAKLKTTQDKIAITSIKKYGHSRAMKNATVKQRMVDTCIDQYGVDNPMKDHNVVQQKIDTCLDVYGHKGSQANLEVIKARVQTVQSKYGVDNVAQAQVVQNKIEATNISKYGCKRIAQHHIPHSTYDLLNDVKWMEDQHHTQKKTIYRIAEELCVTDELVSKHFHLHGVDVNYYFSSQAERDLSEMFDELGLNYIRNTKGIITPQELDFYFPDENIAIEYDGIFWHGEQQGKGRMYHLDKTLKCRELGIRLIHIWEHEWKLKPDIVKSRILSLFKRNNTLYARKCEVVEITSKVARDFTDLHHIQGSVGGSIALGLCYHGELVSVMTFSKSRFSTGFEYELIRFVTKCGNTVVGGASRLFKTFVRLYDPISVISYSDLRWNTGKVYENIGMTLKHVAKPNYFYYRPSNVLKLWSRVSFQKHKLEDKLDNFNGDITEYENMINNGYDRIWDCGNNVYEWNK